MPDILKPNINISDETLDLKNTNNYILSILLSLDELFFCILDTTRNKYIALKSYQLQNIYNFQLLCEKLTQLLTQTNFLKNTYKSVKIIFVNKKSTLIPLPLFEKDKKDTYLKFNHNIEEESIIYDKLNNPEAYNIYALPKCIETKLKDTFSDYKINHHSSCLIESLLFQYKNQAPEEKMFVNVSNSYFDIIVIKNKELLLYNYFNYKTCEDFIYYILFVLEQLKLNPENIDLILLGNIEKRSDLYQILYKYIRNISFGKRNDIFKYSYVFDDLDSHSFYNLLNSNICE